LGGLFVVWGAFFAAIVIHELGHFVAGRIVGFRLQSLQFGPILIAFEFGNLRVRIQPRMASAGLTAMHISSFSRLHYKLMCFISAGPARDLLCAVVVIVLMRAGVILDLHVSGAFRLFAGTSLFCFVTSILPYRGRCNFSDGFRLRMLLWPTFATRRWYAIMGIGMHQRTGYRPRDWNSRWLRVASSNWDNSRDALVGTWAAYVAASDRKDASEASVHLETCLGAVTTGGGLFRDILLVQAGIFQAWFRRDAHKASTWFARARRGKRLSPLLRARFEVYRHFIEGNFALADREWEKGLAIIEKFQDAVLRERLHESWMEWQEEMNERRAVSNAPALEPI
jgi:hypothetical protein